MKNRQFLRWRLLFLPLLIQGLFFPPVSTTPLSRANNRSAKSTRPFRMLVIGDSVMWGQGLTTEHKFSYRVRGWLCEQRQHGICQDSEDIQIHVEAHSGAFIARPQGKDEQEKEEQFTRELSPLRFSGEVNNPYPTVWGQVDLARRYYMKEKISPAQVDLILVNGGINDMGASKILLPLVGGNLTDHATKYCQKAMERLLDTLASTFPNARIVVPGYFLLVSISTPENVLFETIDYLVRRKSEKANGAIEQAAALSTEPLAAVKPSKLLKELAKRSQRWTTVSNAAFAAAVSNFNNTHSRLPLMGLAAQSAPREASLRALFVTVPFSDENAYAAPQTFLWKLVSKPPTLVLECADKDPLKKLMVNDELQKERPCMCDQADKANDVACVRAAAFHPNANGAEQYSQFIIKELEKIWRFTGWASTN